jgi:hypothetical protein
MGEGLWAKVKLLGWKGSLALFLSIVISVPAASFLGYTLIIPIEFAAFLGLKDTISEIWSASPAIVLSYFLAHWISTRTRAILKILRPIVYWKAKVSKAWKPLYVRLRFTYRVARRIEGVLKAVLFALFFSVFYFGDYYGMFFLLWCILVIISNYAIEFFLRFRVGTFSENLDNYSKNRVLFAVIAPVTIISISISFGAGLAKFFSDVSSAAVVETNSRTYCGSVILVSSNGLFVAEHLGHPSFFGFKQNLDFSFVPYASLSEVRERGNDPLCVFNK